MNGLTFLKNNNISWFFVNMKITDGNKELLPYPEENNKFPNYSTDFQDKELITKRQNYTDYETIWIDTTNIQQIDIDSKEAYDEVHSHFAKFPHFLSVRKGLPHYFFTLENSNEFGKRFKVPEIHDDIDILNGQVSYAPADFTVENYTAEINSLSIRIPKSKTDHNNKTFLKTECINELLDIIDSKYVDDFMSWIKIGAALYNCGYSRELFDSFSKRSPKYGGVDKVWNGFCRKKLEDIGFGTICYYCKESDPVSWEKIKIKLMTEIQKTEIEKFLQSGTVLTHSAVAKIFYEAFSEKYVYSCNCWFELTEGGIYNKLTKDSTTILSRDMKNYIQQFLFNVITQTEDENKRKILWKANTQLESHAFKVSCVEEMKQEFIQRELFQTLNQKCSLFGFKNGVYDLNTFEFRKGNTDDKVSMTTKTVFDKNINDTNQLFLENMFDSYFQSKETAHYFKKHLGSLLEGGNKMEKIWFWVGNGRNGKGTTDQMIRNLFGDYYTELNNNFFTIADKHSNQPHPEVVRLKNTRVSMTHEPEGTTKYLTSKFKSLSGGDPLVARQLYQNDEERFIPTMKPIIQTNHLPQFTDCDLGLLQRLVVIDFPYKFLDSSNYDKHDPTHKKCDINLKEKLKNMNNDFFHFLVKYYKLYLQEGLKESNDINKSINTYRKDIDSVKTFVDEALVKTQNEKDRISTADLLYHHNSWGSNKIDRERFAKRLNGCGFDIQRKIVNGSKSKCLTGIKWNDEFKKGMDNNFIDDE